MRATFTLSILLPLLVLACSGEQIAGPELLSIEGATVGVKSAAIFPNLLSSQILSVQDLEYDGEGRLIKRTYWAGERGMTIHYEVFSYDDGGKPVYRLGYHGNVNSPTGFILLDSTVFQHEGKFLTSETTYYLCAGYNDRYDYRYRRRSLVGKMHYHNDELESYTVYEYRNDKLRREVDFSNDSSVIESREYQYEGEAPILLTYYSFLGEPKRTISYSYNEAGMLIIEKVDELVPYSSSMSYVVRYSY